MLYVLLTHTQRHTHKHLCISLHMCPPHAHVKLQQGGVVKCGSLVQVALTDLEDVVDGGGQRLAFGGYVTCNMQRWRGVMTSSV